MAFETDLIRRYSGAFSKEDCARIIDGIKFFDKNHLLFYDREKLTREDHKTVNISHDFGHIIENYQVTRSVNNPKNNNASLIEEFNEVPF